MDNEQSIQSSLGETVKSLDSHEQLFRATIEYSKQGLKGLSAFALEYGATTADFPHLGEVYTNDSHILLPPIEIMRVELVKAGGNYDKAQRTRALRSQKTGQVFIPEEIAGSVHDVLHESIHRAAWLKDRKLGLSVNETQLIRLLAEKYGLVITSEGKVSLDSPYIQKFGGDNEDDRNGLLEWFTKTLKQESHQLVEGITEWTTQRAQGLYASAGSTVSLASEDFGYPDFVQGTNELRDKLIKEKALSKEQADALIITAALTGDFNELLPYIH
jgi:hypothetical protein